MSKGNKNKKYPDFRAKNKNQNIVTVLMVGASTAIFTQNKNYEIKIKINMFLLVQISFLSQIWLLSVFNLTACVKS